MTHALASCFSRLSGRVAEMRRAHALGRELEEVPPAERRRMLAELGLDAADTALLRRPRGDTFQLLPKVLHAAGLDRDALDRELPAVVRDMEIACLRCRASRVCHHDLARDAATQAWRAYCPNADTIASLYKRVH